MSPMALFSTNQLPPLLYSLLFGGQRNLGVDLPQQQHIGAGAGLVNAVGGGRQRHVQLVGEAEHLLLCPIHLRPAQEVPVLFSPR
jgi:hypothetical protein